MSRYPKVRWGGEAWGWEHDADEPPTHKVIPLSALVIETVTPGWELCPQNHPMPVESPSLCIGCDGTGWRRT